MVYVIQLASRIRTELVPSWSCSQAVSTTVWRVPLLFVQWKNPDDGQRNCPEHVDFYSESKFEKWVHLVGFIIRIYHDARSLECQILLIIGIIRSVLLGPDEHLHIFWMFSCSVISDKRRSSLLTTIRLLRFLTKVSRQT